MTARLAPRPRAARRDHLPHRPALNLIPSFELATMRIPGVLQRIALTVMLAAPIVLWGGWRAALAAIAGVFSPCISC